MRKKDKKRSRCEIIRVRTDAQLEQVRNLFREYFEFLRGEHDLDIGYQGIAEELAALPGHFSAPEGRLVLAVDHGVPTGCAALRPMETDICELKRMYVRPEFRGQGIGKALACHLIEEARSIGYRIMRLDTGNFLLTAQNLYRSLGFITIEPYHDVPEDVRSVAVFMELAL